MSAVRCTGPNSWQVTDKGLWASPVRVPVFHLTIEDACPVGSEGGWVCTRPKGHSGRHAAACSNGEVMEVWS